MTNKKDYLNKCFSPNWIEINLETIQDPQKEVIVVSNAGNESVDTNERKESLETRKRKDLETLLKELEQIKQNIERVAEKQHRLANLMSFYTGDLAQ